MKVQVTHGSIQDATADTVIINLFDDVTNPSGATGAIDQALNGAVSNLIANGDISGKLGRVGVLYPGSRSPIKRVLVAGMGKRTEFNLEGVRQAAANAINKAKEHKAKNIATIVHGAGIAGLDVETAAQATVEGTLLALYEFDAPKQKKEPHTIQSITIIEHDEKKVDAIKRGMDTAVAISSGVVLARDLVNMPANIATPSKMARTAKTLAADHKLGITVGGRRWAKRHNMGAFLAVAQGAGEKPKFIILEHNGQRDDLDTIVLIGKGITFDTGGISLKPAENMGNMKSDMGGAAAVLGAMKAVAQLNLPLRVIGITPCTENMPDASAYRPADIITASNGKTIEIISTDAEGRMVLADALVYATKYYPAAVIDLATLTGACIIALGSDMAAGLFSTDDRLRDQLVAAGTTTHERVWPLPLWDDYKKAIESDVADMKNSGGRYGGVATSAIFLKEFINYSWAHLDIAGMALSDKGNSYTPKGGTGYGVRLLVEFLRSWRN